MFFLVMILGCKEKRQATYEQGFRNCDQLVLKKKMGVIPDIALHNAECLIGYEIPEFESISVKGEAISKKSLKGRISILNFWFSTCQPCIAEIPGFNAIVEKFGNNNVNYISIGRDNEKDIVEFLEDHPWKFQHLPSNGDLIENKFKIRWGFPTTFLLNKESEIVFTFSGGKTDTSAARDVQDKLNPIIEGLLK